MHSRLIGGILLIVGTSIGGGMLALPLATSGLGFWASSLLLVLVWLIMTFSAFLILEVNLWFAPESNFISMARATLGRAGELIMWVSYLLLLYALLSAYIAGGSDLIGMLLKGLHLNVSDGVDAFLFLLIFGSIVSVGIRLVDLTNRGLMAIKLISYLLLVLFSLRFVHGDYLNGFGKSYLTGAVMPVVTSFGFATIMPSLRNYFNSDVKKLRIAIFVGSLIPLICYLLWDAVVQGSIQSMGENGLIAMSASSHQVASLTSALSALSGKAWLDEVVHTFTAICVTTSFLGVALCLVDFLKDGLHLHFNLRQKIWPVLLAFVPPFILVAFAPGIFIKALGYAGIMCVIILVLLPGLMAYAGRYYLNLGKGYEVLGGRSLLTFQVLMAIVLTIFALMQL